MEIFWSIEENLLKWKEKDLSDILLYTIIYAETQWR